MVVSKNFHKIERDETIRLVQKSSKSEPSSRFFSRVQKALRQQFHLEIFVYHMPERSDITLGPANGQPLTQMSDVRFVSEFGASPFGFAAAALRISGVSLASQDHWSLHEQLPALNVWVIWGWRSWILRPSICDEILKNSWQSMQALKLMDMLSSSSPLFASSMASAFFSACSFNDSSCCGL